MEGELKKIKTDKIKSTGEIILLCLKRLGLPPDLRKHILKDYLLPLYVTKSIWINQEAGFFDCQYVDTKGYKQCVYECYNRRFYIYFLKQENGVCTWTRSLCYYNSYEEACKELASRQFTKLPHSMRPLGPFHWFAGVFEPIERGFVFGSDEIKIVKL